MEVNLSLMVAPSTGPRLSVILTMTLPETSAMA